VFISEQLQIESQIAAAAGIASVQSNRVRKYYYKKVKASSKQNRKVLNASQETEELDD
jgi:hypothetical protein